MSAEYEIMFHRLAEKEFERLPKSVLRILEPRIAALAINPFPPGAVLVKGYDHFLRIRIGQYRVIYEVATTIRIVTILRVRHRKDVYKRL